MEELTDLERAVLAVLLEGDTPEFEILRAQATAAVAAKRELTGAGFYTDLCFRGHAPALPGNPRFMIGGVGAEISGLQAGAGFLLWGTAGLIDCIEGFAHLAFWPAHVGAFSLTRDDLHPPASAASSASSSGPHEPGAARLALTKIDTFLDRS